MKCSLTILLIGLCAVFSFVHAQSYQKGDWIISLNIGPGFSNIRNAEFQNRYALIPPEKYLGTGEAELIHFPSRLDAASNIYYKHSMIKDVRIGFSTALQLEYFIGNRSSLQFGLHYDQKGVDAEVSDSWVKSIHFPQKETDITLAYSAYCERRLKNNYLSLPLSYKRYLFNQRIFVQAGGYISYLLSSNLYAFQQEAIMENINGLASSSPLETVTPSVRGYKNNLNIKSETHKLDYGLSFGAGYLHPLSDRLALKTELLMTYGFRKIDAKGDNQLETYENSIGQHVYTNNYFGINSNAKNFHLAWLFGVSYRINKRNE